MDSPAVHAWKARLPYFWCVTSSLYSQLFPHLSHNGVKKFLNLPSWKNGKKSCLIELKKIEDFLKNPAFHQISNQKMCKSFTNPCAKQKIRILFQKIFHPIVNGTRLPRPMDKKLSFRKFSFNLSFRIDTIYKLSHTQRVINLANRGGQLLHFFSVFVELDCPA